MDNESPKTFYEKINNNSKECCSDKTKINPCPGKATAPCGKRKGHAKLRLCYFQKVPGEKGDECFAFSNYLQQHHRLWATRITCGNKELQTCVQRDVGMVRAVPYSYLPPKVAFFRGELGRESCGRVGFEKGPLFGRIGIDRTRAIFRGPYVEDEWFRAGGSLFRAGKCAAGKRREDFITQLELHRRVGRERDR
ncbi:phenylalanine--tRNA ligase alpha subunit [Anopheles sinensis]|uniref:Phenylalanine--tRNA ligase alpha subunit n=1 Tax=Anopheles sinensis TaxID=74873 RepID=A0A084VMN7_ANOSI|nr:phenylalanine--tRNA ligase alpha subunit [Anopheles sinensis]